MKLAHNIAHLLFPRDSNNHKARLLHTPYLFYIVIFLLVFQIALEIIPATGARILGYAAQIDTNQIIELTNQKRNDAGLSPLTKNSQLEQAAKAKGEHMLANDYWAHVAPDGTEPWAFFGNVGYSYKYAGENLARDFSSANATVDAWMASPSHRDNMLSSKYREIGIAVVEGDLAGEEATIVVQLFGTPLVDTTPQVPIAEAQVQPTAVPTFLPTAVPTTLPTSSPAPSATPTTVFIAQQQPPAGPESLEGVTGGDAPSDTRLLEVLVSPFNSTRTISAGLIILLMGVLAIDASVIARRQIKRLSGRVVAHLAFLGMILAILLIAKAGQIL